MVFLTDEEPVVAYGVVALFDPFEDVIGPYLPRMIKTTLLPFKGRIVYDGLVTGYNVFFGGGIKRRLNESYKEAKERFGIVTSLPSSRRDAAPGREEATPKKRATRAGKAGGKSTTTEKARRAHDEIVGLTDAFCREHLDDEYGALCRKLAGRPGPQAALAADPRQARVLGQRDRAGRRLGQLPRRPQSQPHHMKMTDIDEAFGVSEATGSAKSKAIRDLLKIRQLRPRMDAAQPHGRQPADLDAGGQRPHHGHPQVPEGGPGGRLREGPDPLHPRRSGGRIAPRSEPWPTGKRDRPPHAFSRAIGSGSSPAWPTPTSPTSPWAAGRGRSR